MSFRSGWIWVHLAVMFSIPCWAQEPSTRRIKVQDDFQKIVPGEVFRIDAKGSSTSLGLIDDTGYFVWPEQCEPGVKVHIAPRNIQYYPYTEFCSEIKDSIIVTSKKVARTLEVKALAFEKTGKHADAALLYRELFNRIHFADPERAAATQVAEQRVIAQMQTEIVYHGVPSYGELQAQADTTVGDSISIVGLDPSLFENDLQPGSGSPGQ